MSAADEDVLDDGGGNGNKTEVAKAETAKTEETFSPPTPSLSTVGEQIEELYRFRDAYFTAVPEAEFSLKNARIESQLKNILSTLEAEALAPSRAEDPVTYSFLKARLLNIRTDYDPEVKELLTKAVKLKPADTALWNELGECYRKADDFKMALTCFETALKNCPTDRSALRSASIILRSLPATSGEERRANILRSVDLAKRALASEGGLAEPASWVVLANAYLTLLCSSSRWEALTHPQQQQQQQKSSPGNSLLKSAKSAYQKALFDREVATKADVLFNYASVLQYEEDFGGALRYLALALKFDAEWRELAVRRRALASFLGDIAQRQATAAAPVKKKTSEKRLRTLREKLAADEDRLRARYADDEDLCCGVVRRLGDLQEEGQVNECLLPLRVLSYDSSTTDAENGVFLAAVFTVIDAAGASAALFIYDIAQRRGTEAGRQRHRIDLEEGGRKVVEFEAIKVERPLVDIYVNGRRLEVASLSTPVVNVTLKSD
ncbi:Tetratricopeptide repeat protein 5 [Tyrophagus putrescentiae]|nr:Tetratricopeptide repeat protein 5 [Tyrophagus putrescentiae]